MVPIPGSTSRRAASERVCVGGGSESNSVCTCVCVRMCTLEAWEEGWGQAASPKQPIAHLSMSLRTAPEAAALPCPQAQAKA